MVLGRAPWSGVYFVSGLCVCTQTVQHSWVASQPESFGQKSVCLGSDAFPGEIYLTSSDRKAKGQALVIFLWDAKSKPCYLVLAEPWALATIEYLWLSHPGRTVALTGFLLLGNNGSHLMMSSEIFIFSKNVLLSPLSVISKHIGWVFDWLGMRGIWWVGRWTGWWNQIFNIT